MNWIFLRGAVCFVWPKDITKKAACTKTCLLSTVKRKRLVFCSPFCFRPCSRALWGAAVCVSVSPESSRLLEDMIWLKLDGSFKVCHFYTWMTFCFFLLLSTFHCPCFFSRLPYYACYHQIILSCLDMFLELAALQLVFLPGLLRWFTKRCWIDSCLF